MNKDGFERRLKVNGIRKCIRRCVSQFSLLPYVFLFALRAVSLTHSVKEATTLFW
jgi:hypothetical protein